MPSISIQRDEFLLQSLNRIAPATKSKRPAFVRDAVREAIRRHEFENIREAYLRQPDSAAAAEDWSTAQKWDS